MLQSPTINPFQTIQVFVSAIPVFLVFQSLQTIVFCFPFGDLGPFGLQAACLLGVRNSEIFWWSDPLELGCSCTFPTIAVSQGPIFCWVQAQHLWVSSGLELYHRGSVKNFQRWMELRLSRCLGDINGIFMQARWTKMGLDGYFLFINQVEDISFKSGLTVANRSVSSTPINTNHFLQWALSLLRGFSNIVGSCTRHQRMEPFSNWGRES